MMICEWCGWPIEVDEVGVERALLPSPNPKEQIVEYHEVMCPEYKKIMGGLDKLIDDLEDEYGFLVEYWGG